MQNLGKLHAFKFINIFLFKSLGVIISFTFDHVYRTSKKKPDILYKQTVLSKPFCQKHKQSLELAWQLQQNSWWLSRHRMLPLSCQAKE